MLASLAEESALGHLTQDFEDTAVQADFEFVGNQVLEYVRCEIWRYPFVVSKACTGDMLR